MLITLSQATAQSYESMWKKAAEAAEKDLPKTELTTVRQISDKAQANKSYGNLIAAELRAATLLGCVSNDSVAPAIQRLEDRVSKESDPTMKAIWHAALGKLYYQNNTLVDLRSDEEIASAKNSDKTYTNSATDNLRKARAHFIQALSDIPLLASQKSATYAPVITQGEEGAFGHDLLHVIGFAAGEANSDIDAGDFTRLGVFKKMHDYYEKVNNRKAACICALKMVELSTTKRHATKVVQSSYLQQLDSLTRLYQDLPEAGEVALERYSAMEYATDVPAKDKIAYIDYALQKWGNWQGMNKLRNDRKTLTNPMFSLKDLPLVSLPGKSQWLVINEARNILSLTVKISKLDITSEYNFNVDDEKTYKELLGKVLPAHQTVKTKQFVGYTDYQVVKDSVELPTLPLGAYLMEVTTDNADIKPYRHLFYVSDLALMAQELPDGNRRYVAVNATTGQPIEGASILVYKANTEKAKRTILAQLTTDCNGEVTTQIANGIVWLSTKADKYTPASWLYVNRRSYYENKYDKTNVSMFTDRSLYRPGQTVHATAVCFVRKKGIDAQAYSEEGKQLKMTLRNANNKVVAEKSVTLDSYGTASADFQLPEDGLTGNYFIETSLGQWNRKYIKVEEYKRPTFEVTFQKVDKSYKWGDTITVKGVAKTYAGVPVQGAKVEYSIERHSSWWWWRANRNNMRICDDTTTTAEDGTFEVSVPFEPEDTDDSHDFLRRTNFYDFDISATVTDLGGESHEGSLTLPLGTKATAFSVDIPERMVCDSMKLMTFSYKNSAGTDIAGKVSYRINEGEWQYTDANKAVDLKAMRKEWSSGRYTIEAICGEDSIKKDFIVFSMEDRHPVSNTQHWCYQSGQTFPADGNPVYVQIGSSDKGVHIVYSLIAGNNLLEKGTWDINDSIVTRSFTYQSEYASGLVLNYAFVKDGKLYSNRIEMARPLPDKQLKMTWKTFRNRLVPGQKEEWTLHITTPDGKPAKAQLLSVLYDKSLDQLKQNIWRLSLGLYQQLPNSPWHGNLNSQRFTATRAYPVKYDEVKDCSFDSFVSEFFDLEGCGSSLYDSMFPTWKQTFRKNSNTVKIKKDSYISSRGYATTFMAKASMSSLSDRTVSVGSEAAASPIAMKVDSEGANNTESIVAHGKNPSDDSQKKQTGEDTDLDNVSVRTNLNETAFYYPALETDAKGNVSIKFTLPESVTTWKFMGLAHDKEMRNALIESEAVARKVVMVQPNLPRFLREGDKATVLTKVFNTSEKKLTGNARMQLIDPENGNVVWQQEQRYTIDGNGTTALSFHVEGLKEGVYINKVVATAGTNSDGEQSYLPVLSNRELVTNTLPLTLTGKGEKSFDLSPLFKGKDGKEMGNVSNAKLTIEYTNNPSWLMIQALPAISNPTNHDNAISLMSAIYSNSIARHIMTQSPVIKQVVELWKNEQKQQTSSDKNASSLSSSLEKNQELKNIILNETPWVMDADKESEQKASLINYFDESLNANRLSSEITKLKALQNADGSFSWWKGMQGSRYMTTAVVKMMVRLNMMVGKQEDTASMLRSAMTFLHKEAAEEVAEMKKQEAKVKEEMEKKASNSTAQKALSDRLADIRPSESAIDYLYILSLDGTTKTCTVKSNADYLVKKMADRTNEFTIYGKALAAIILGKNNYKEKASDYLQSISEYTVYRPEMGRYFDTNKAYYSWYDYKIPTQVAAIEAMQLLSPEDSAYKQEIKEMKLWLLQSKRTQAWDTPINTVDAVYAFMKDNTQILEKDAENASLSLDGKRMELPKATAGLGYVKTAKDGTAKQLIIDKKDEKTSWGAVYAQYTMPANEIAAAVSGIKVTRSVENAGNASMGDKVKVTLVITADRDYDFVQVEDKRAACLEPVNQISGYQWGMGCYVASGDYKTSYFFNRLSKGRHLIETEYYIDRQGDYQSGTCSAQCAYSPEFCGRTEAYQITINK